MTSSEQPEGEALFLRAVGMRVRRARERKGIARRVLSEQSGISQRYLAQLEGGSGNISIALLKRVADALDHRIEWLISEDDPWVSETALFAERFRTATLDQRERVMDILDPNSPGQLRAGRICLVGLRGAGKSTLGAMLGEAIGLPFLELNQEIRQQAGMPVTEVMALYGQEGYRQLEGQALERIVAGSDAMVLAVAGGIVSEPETYAYLLRHFHTIWLKAAPEEHMQRVRAQGDERPMAGNPKAMDELKSILMSREALYARAEAMVDTSGKTLQHSFEDLVALVREIRKDQAADNEHTH
ncbi:MAG: helix-turn-helix transcriptional regulator [Nitratireductor sp.]|nr:helix-turn-helix transcriptional regulator [Nitratireductor sp.]